MVHNNVDFFTPILATWLCGGVASVVNPNSRVEALADQLQNTATSVIFCYPKIVNHAIEAINLNQVIYKLHIVRN
jgi:acyl-coenzyme A synthetase/AMP-(fatty) acid ligase